MLSLGSSSAAAALDDRSRLKYEALTILSVLGIGGGLALTFVDFMSLHPIAGAADISAALLLAINLIYLKNSANVTLASVAGFTIVLALTLMAFFTAGAPMLFWIYMFPWLAFFLFGLRTGMIVNFILALGIVLLLNRLVIDGASLSNVRIDIVASYLMLTAIAFAYENSKLKLERKLRLASATDELTGALNRRRFAELTEREMDRSDRYGTPFSVIMLDMDHFKNINDEYGHRVGDRVLQEVVNMITRRIRKSDDLIRYGGEEFMILAPMTNIYQAQELAECIRASVAEHTIPVVGKISVSAGVAGYRELDDVDTLVNRADAAMYRAKRMGRNRVEISD